MSIFYFLGFSIARGAQVPAPGCVRVAFDRGSTFAALALALGAQVVTEIWSFTNYVFGESAAAAAVSIYSNLNPQLDTPERGHSPPRWT